MSTNNTGTARLAAAFEDERKKDEIVTSALVEQADELAEALAAWTNAMRPADTTEKKENDK